MWASRAKSKAAMEVAAAEAEAAEDVEVEAEAETMKTTMRTRRMKKGGGTMRMVAAAEVPSCGSRSASE
jgi:hypothetical protein